MDLDDLDQDRLFDAIRKGVADGIYAIATNATMMPTHDFFDSIQAGVREAIKDIGHPPERRPEPED